MKIKFKIKSNLSSREGAEGAAWGTEIHSPKNYYNECEIVNEKQVLSAIWMKKLNFKDLKNFIYCLFVNAIEKFNNELYIW